jgi:tetraacyldisaccharide 4'-kinase
VELLKSADGIVLTKVNLVKDAAGLSKKIQVMAGSVPVFQAALAPVRLIQYSTQTQFSLNDLKERKVVCFSGIGNPKTFRNILEQLGAKISKELIFRDHHVYTDQDEEAIGLAVKEAACDFVITTEKDIFKISKDAIEKLNLYVLMVELVITGNKEDWDTLLTGQTN